MLSLARKSTMGMTLFVIGRRVCKKLNITLVTDTVTVIAKVNTAYIVPYISEMNGNYHKSTLAYGYYNNNLEKLPK